MLRVVAEFTAACDYTHCLTDSWDEPPHCSGNSILLPSSSFPCSSAASSGIWLCFEWFSRDCAAGCTLTYVVSCLGSTWCFGAIARGPPSAPPLCVGTLTLCPYCVYLLFISWPFCNYTTACDCTKQHRTAPNSLFISWSHCVWYLQSSPPLHTHPLFSPSEPKTTCKVLR